MSQKLFDHLRAVYGFLDQVSPVTREFPAWTIEKGVAHQDYAGAHPKIKFRIGVDLTPGKKVSDLRNLSWKIETVLREFLRDGRFNSAADVRTVYETVGVGLTLKDYDTLTPSQKVNVSKGGYNSVRDACTNFEREVLQKIHQAGKLNDAYICVGDMGGPEEVSFLDRDGFYLRPPILLDFLCGKNTAGGPEDFGLRYSVKLGENESVFHEFNLSYNPEGRVLTIDDWGLWKLDNRRLRYLNPQPAAEQKAKEDSPLVKLLESFR